MKFSYCENIFVIETIDILDLCVQPAPGKYDECFENRNPANSHLSSLPKINLYNMSCKV